MVDFEVTRYEIKLFQTKVKDKYSLFNILWRFSLTNIKHWIENVMYFLLPKFKNWSFVMFCNVLVWLFHRGKRQTVWNIQDRDRDPRFSGVPWKITDIYLVLHWRCFFHWCGRWKMAVLFVVSCRFLTTAKKEEISLGAKISKWKKITLLN